MIREFYPVSSDHAPDGPDEDAEVVGGILRCNCSSQLSSLPREQFLMIRTLSHNVQSGLEKEPILQIGTLKAFYPI